MGQLDILIVGAISNVRLVFPLSREGGLLNLLSEQTMLPLRIFVSGSLGAALLSLSLCKYDKDVVLNLVWILDCLAVLLW